MSEKKILNSLYGIPFANPAYNIIIGGRSSGKAYQVRLDICKEIIKLYYNGLSERTLNKRYPKEFVKAALHSPEFDKVRKHYQTKKREAFENYWKQEGIPRLAGDE